ncbi:hypothetical protein GQ53DRAFT_745349 [Thozetella sp. PMI_491]|nr:hypothetical protein GQ53DRAFT_745349 [Thozetella sp. PMI_491]
MESTRMKTAKKYIKHFETLDIPLLKVLLSDDFAQEFAPASINPPGPFDKQGFLKHHEHLLDVMTGFPVTGKEYIESESSNQVIVWATAQAEFRDDVRDGEPAEYWGYHGEYIFIITLDETGEKIVRIVEFLDSKATVEGLMALMQKANENKAKKLAAGSK